MDTDFQDRIQSLERRLRWMSVAMLVMVVGAVSMAVSPDWNSEIRARSFVVVNDTDKPCGVLGSHNNAAYIALFDDQHRHRIRIGLSSDNAPQVVLYRADERPALAAGLVGDSPVIRLLDDDHVGVRLEASHGEAVVALSDRNGQQRIHLAAGDETRLSVRDAKERSRMELFSVDDAAGIGIKDIDGRQRILLTEIPGSGPVLIMTDGERKPIVKLPE